MACAYEALRQQPIAAHLGGPGAVLEHARVGRQAHIGVDERGAAEPTPHQDVSVIAEPDVEEPGARAEPQLGAGDLHLFARGRRPVGEVAGLELAAALEHGDAASAAGEP